MHMYYFYVEAVRARMQQLRWLVTLVSQRLLMLLMASRAIRTLLGIEETPLDGNSLDYLGFKVEIYVLDAIESI